MNNPIAIRTDSLTKSFVGSEVIRDCTISVPRESIYGFLGPNGAGKTTVMKMLLGLLRPSSGSIEVLGMSVESHKDKILKSVGSLIEVPVFYEHLSAAENLELHLAYMNAPDIDVFDMLEQVGLRHTGQQPVSKFSLGMRQRLAIARSIIHQPELLILDEPINGLDPMAIREMRSLFTHLVNEKGMTIFMSSHIISEVEMIADRVGMINAGKVEIEVSVKEVKSNYKNGLEDFFFEVMDGGYRV